MHIPKGICGTTHPDTRDGSKVQYICTEHPNHHGEHYDRVYMKYWANPDKPKE